MSSKLEIKMFAMLKFRVNEDEEKDCFSCVMAFGKG